MQENQGSGCSCGKACGWTCGGCAVLILAIIILSMFMFKGLFESVKDVQKIVTYFDDLKDQGWDVDDSQSNQTSGYGASVDTETPMIWRARESSDDEWIDYVWVLGFDEAMLEQLESFGDLQDLKFMFLPRTEAALEVHEELELPLPDDFELVPWDEDGGQRPDPDRDRDDETDEDDEEPRRRQKDGKSFRFAA